MGPPKLYGLCLAELSNSINLGPFFKKPGRSSRVPCLGWGRSPLPRQGKQEPNPSSFGYLFNLVTFLIDLSEAQVTHEKFFSAGNFFNFLLSEPPCGGLGGGYYLGTFLI